MNSTSKDFECVVPRRILLPLHKKLSMGILPGLGTCSIRACLRAFIPSIGLLFSYPNAAQINPNSI